VQKLLSRALRSQLCESQELQMPQSSVGGFWAIVFARNDTFCTRSAVSADGPGRPDLFAAHRQPLNWNFFNHPQFFLSVGGSVWYLVRNLRCTVTIDSVLANSKTQKSFLYPVLTMYRHDCPLAVKLASVPWLLLPKQNLERFSTYWYVPFCCVCLDCCATDFRNSGGTYELLYILCHVGHCYGNDRERSSDATAVTV
jgi:hypothetical protein